MQKHKPISRKLFEAVKLYEQRQYKIAHQIGINTATLSQIVNGILITREGDIRVVRLGEIVGVSADECYAKDGE